MANEFVHLHVHSQYSLLDGVSHFGPLFDQVKKMGMDSVALTDHGNMFGAVAFYQQALKAGVKPIVGCEFYVSPTTHTDRESREARQQLHLVLLAKDFEGYLNLCYLSSRAYLDGFYYKPRIDKELLASHKDGLIALSACLSGVVAQYFADNRPNDAYQVADDYAQIMGPDHFYIELMDHGLEEQKKVNQHLVELARKMNLPMVATNDAHYLKRTDDKTQELLMAIGTGKTFADENRFRFDASEFYLKSPQEMIEQFGHIEGAIENTVAIAERCNPVIKFRQDLSEEEQLLPEFSCPDQKTPEQYLRELVEEGLRERYGEITGAVEERYEHEMEIITGMGFVSYFLVVWDFVNFARRNNIPSGCRGSGAGSIVAYALDITELDPLKYKLFFERFLNPERVSMPDFDIDLCQVRRAEVIEYVRDKYGADNVANIITFGTIKARASIRDVGRVMNLPLDLVDRVAKLIPEGPKVTIASALEDCTDLAELYETDPQIKELIDRAKKIEGTVRQPGIHAAGVVVCKKPLIEAIPLYRPPGKDDVTTQYNMVEVEELGLLKIDFLGLKTHTMISDCIRLIEENHGVKVDWKAIGFEDEKAYGVLQRGDGFGVFQVESQGMRDMLRRAMPTNIEDITALIALYRPGSIDFMDSFIDRKHGRESVAYPHPDMEEMLKETFGIMIYQEQVMQVTNVLAGFSLGEADILRRAMSKKKEKVMAEMKVKFLAGAKEKNISEDVAEEVFAMIHKFASYGFNKAHAASYAVLTFRTAWLKGHYPAEFMASLLTAEIRTGASDKLGMYIGVTRDMDLEVLPPDINASQAFFSVVEGKIRFGLAAIKNVGQGPVAHILEERKNGPFQSVQDFFERIDTQKVNTRAVECLIKTGAFDQLEPNRRQLFENRETLLAIGTAQRDMKMRGQTSLFDMMNGDEGEGDSMITLEPFDDWTDREKFNAEKELAGIFLSGHPLDRYAEDLKQYTDTRSMGLQEKKDGDAVRMGGMISDLRQITTKSGDPMAFVQVEDREGKFEVVVFPKVFEKCRAALVLDGPIYVEGKVQVKDPERPAQTLADKVLPLDKLEQMLESGELVNAKKALLPFRLEMQSFASHFAEALPGLKEDEKVQMAGQLVQCREITSSKGEAMAFAELEDPTGRYEVIFFPRVWEKCHSLVVGRAVLFIEGQVNKNSRDGSTKLAAQSAVPLETVRNSRARYVDISLPAEEMEQEHLNELRRLFRRNKGGLAVRLRLSWNGSESVLIEANSRYRVNPSNGFLDDLEALKLPLGKVLLKEK